MSDPILRGKDDREGVVGLHPFGASEMKVYYSSDRTETVEFDPFLHCTSHVADKLSEGFHLSEVISLSGSNEYDAEVRMNRYEQFYDVKDWLRENAHSDDYYIEHSPTVQFLQQTGITLYGGMEMSDVHRMQIDIETYSKDGFPDASRESDEVIIIAMSDNRGWRTLLHTADVPVEHGMSLSTETKMLQQFIRTIHRKDPDTLEFHNGLGFDLPYLQERCNLCNVAFAIGRDNSVPKSWESTKDFAEREVDYTNFVVAGRSVVDSYFLAADYDTYARDLPSYGLKDLAQHFGLAREGREYVEGDKISQVWDSEPSRLLEYALDDVIETRGVVEQLGNASFALTKIVPMTWQESVIAGTASTLESIMVREYIRQGRSLPAGSEPQKFAGGYTEVFHQGVFHDLAYADVSSLYPSIMLHWDVTPDSDEIGVFQHILERLTELRLKNKEKLKELDKDSKKYSKIDAEQASQKILINSSYGMISFPFALFSDIQKGAFVTKKGREILKKMIREILTFDTEVVLGDTDGCMFVVPKDLEAEDVIQSVDNSMPEGIEIDCDYKADTVVSYKAKNYAKVIGGELEISGASLMGRQKQPFLRDYIKDQLKNLAEENVSALLERHVQCLQAIMNGQIDAKRLCKRSRLKKSLDEYDEGVENDPNKHQLAQYEVAKRKWDITGIKPKRGDTVKYYVSQDGLSDLKVSRQARLLREYDDDEDKSYYIKRLNKTAELFYPFVESPNEVFPKSAGQTSLLFNSLDSQDIQHNRLNEYP